MPLHARFVATVMASREAEGGRVDVGSAVPALLTAAGFAIEQLRPHSDIIGASERLAHARMVPPSVVEVIARRQGRGARLRRARGS